MNTTTLNARRPLTRSEMVAQSTARAGRLLSEGYRVSRAADTLCVTKPDGTYYLVNVAARQCGCRRNAEFGFCSHGYLAAEITRICAQFGSGVTPQLFDHHCPQCAGPAWSGSERVGGSGSGRSVRVGVCPSCGCHPVAQEAGR